MNYVLRGWRARALDPTLVCIGIVVLGVAVTIIWFGLGVFSPPGLLLTAGAVVLTGAWVFTSAPQLLLLMISFLLPFQAVANVYPYELSFLAFSMLLTLRLVKAGSVWLTRLSPVEVANAGFLLWAMFTGFWCDDTAYYLLGVRRLIGGWLAFWVAFRMARYLSKQWFEVTLISIAYVLSISALLKRLSFGLDVRVSRTAATDLGWGTANFVATILLLLTPPLLAMALRNSKRWLSWATWPALVLIATLQILIASRAATALFAIGVFAQLGRGQLRRRWLGIGLAVAAFAGLLMSPWGTTFLSRFVNPKDLGSMLVRIWYVREAWHRTIDNLPWGIGLTQGLRYSDHLGGIDPHNYWLVLSTDLGIPGVILWIAVLVQIWRQLEKLVAMPQWRAEGRALQIAFVLSQLHTLVEPTFQGIQYEFLYFLVFGGYLGYAMLDRSKLQRGPSASIAR